MPAAERLGGIAGSTSSRTASYRLPVTLSSFHGRDIFAPAAAHLSLGVPIEDLGRALDPARLVPSPIADPILEDGALRSSVVYSTRSATSSSPACGPTWRPRSARSGRATGSISTSPADPAARTSSWTCRGRPHVRRGRSRSPPGLRGFLWADLRRGESGGCGRAPPARRGSRRHDPALIRRASTSSARHALDGLRSQSATLRGRLPRARGSSRCVASGPFSSSCSQALHWSAAPPAQPLSRARPPRR